MITNTNFQTIKGTTISTGTGSVDSGTIRVAVATSDSIGASVDIAQVNGNTVATNEGNVSDGTLRVCVADDNIVNTSMTTDLLPISLGQKGGASSLAVVQASDFPVPTQISGQKSKTHSITSAWDITAAQTYVKPMGFDATDIGIPPHKNSQQQFYVYSSDAADTQTLYIEGYIFGDRISESVTLNGTTVVSTVNQYFGITWFGAKADATFAGSIYLSEQNSNTAARAYAVIPAGSTTNRAFINIIAIPPSRNLYILSLDVKRTVGSLVHKLILRKTNDTSTTAITTTTKNMLVDAWAIINNSEFKPDGVRIPNPNIYAEYCWFECLGANTDTAEAYINCIFMIADD